jgi:hypothetical protein
MKIDDCVRGLKRASSARAPVQLAQLQFHCGKPPPAAAPRTVMRMEERAQEEQRPGGRPGRRSDAARR